MFASVSVTTAHVSLLSCIAEPLAVPPDPLSVSILVSAASPASGAAVARARLEIAHHFANVPDPRQRLSRAPPFE
jgi:hypothetical protein